jgi:hypothetical protein
MNGRELEEYRALRATIRERGTARVWLFVIGLAAWSASSIAATVLTPCPIGSLLPLLLLAAVFEVVFALHFGVERIGRYLQVFYEDPPERRWEQTVMAFGRTFPGGGSDPLFCLLFVIATAAGQRATDLERFEHLRREMSPPA